jgi:hypothetical protein
MKSLAKTILFLTAVFVPLDAYCQTQPGQISITNIAKDQFINGTVTGLANPQKYCVVVYVHTDVWYIHPFAGQGDGKSYAKIDTKGNWQIETVRRDFKADKIGALVLANCANVPGRTEDLGSINPNFGITILHLSGSKHDGDV